jgi:large subunit ribosomal protein L9
MKTEVILTHNIVGLGGESDQVKVASGYARNYLFPQRLAVPLTQTNKRQIEALRQRRAEREAHEFNTMSELAKGISKLTCVIKVKAGEDGKMFGSVTAGMIADELKHQFDIALDKRKIHLEYALKALGEYEIELHLHPEVKSTLKVRVESLTPITAPPPEAAPAEAREEKPKTEKRGHGRREAEGGQPEKSETAGEKRPRTSQTEKPARAARTAKAPKAEKQEKAE